MNQYQFGIKESKFPPRLLMWRRQNYAISLCCIFSFVLLWSEWRGFKNEEIYPRLRRLSKENVEDPARFLTEYRTTTTTALVSNLLFKEEIPNDQQRNRKIPLRLLQVAQSHEIPPTARRLMRTWHKFHPDIQHYVADDEQMWPFVNYFYNETITEAMKNVPVGAIRSDIFRLMLVYQYGGFYADTDVGLHATSLNTLVKNWTLCSFLVHEMIATPDCLSQYFFGASPKHPIVGFILDYALQQLMEGSIEFSESDFVVKLAGPVAFTHRIIEYIELHFPQSLVYNKTIHNMLDFIDTNHNWLEEEGICISRTHGVIHSFASVHPDAGWRSTGWSSWRKESALVRNTTDEELVKNGIMDPLVTGQQ
jgi:mannosyltransferase OCH1-like enzyme